MHLLKYSLGVNSRSGIFVTQSSCASCQLPHKGCTDRPSHHRGEAASQKCSLHSCHATMRAQWLVLKPCDSSLVKSHSWYFVTPVSRCIEASRAEAKGWFMKWCASGYKVFSQNQRGSLLNIPFYEGNILKRLSR